MNRPIHFELHSTDPARTTAFFESVFGWRISRWPGPEEYMLCSTGDPGSRGIDGGVMRTRDGQQRTVNTLEVEHVDAALAAVTAAGGQIVVPKMAIKGMGYLAYCTDPTGVLFGVTHMDPTAE